MPLDAHGGGAVPLAPSFHATPWRTRGEWRNTARVGRCGSGGVARPPSLADEDSSGAVCRRDAHGVARLGRGGVAPWPTQAARGPWRLMSGPTV